jgi:exopolyphosphatase / guanosine-5'-triphosphate,3'-diphosphate pyrophosphatase
MMRAAIDLGTNTCLLLILSDEGQILHDESRTVRLGEGLANSGQFSAEAMDRTIQALRDYSSILKKNSVALERVVAVSTASGRNARNAAEFFKTVKDESGLSFRILSGKEEALATFLGADPGDDDCVIDIGGGSTEIVTESSLVSLDIGSVNLTERFLLSDPVTDQEFWSLEEFAEFRLAEALNKFTQPSSSCIAVAGTATTLAAIQLGLPQFDRGAIDSVVLTVGDLHRWVEDLKWRSVEERKKIPGMEPSRASVILAGAMILWKFMSVSKVPALRVSTRGLRFGVLHEKFVTS